MVRGVRVSPEQMNVQALAAALAEVARQVAQMDIHQLRLEILSAARTREMVYIAVVNQHLYVGTGKRNLARIANLLLLHLKHVTQVRKMTVEIK
jgi:hypothetical protein